MTVFDKIAGLVLNQRSGIKIAGCLSFTLFRNLLNQFTLVNKELSLAKKRYSERDARTNKQKVVIVVIYSSYNTSFDIICNLVFSFNRNS